MRAESLPGLGSNQPNYLIWLTVGRTLLLNFLENQIVPCFNLTVWAMFSKIGLNWDKKKIIKYNQDVIICKHVQLPDCIRDAYKVTNPSCERGYGCISTASFVSVNGLQWKA